MTAETIPIAGERADTKQVRGQAATDAIIKATHDLIVEAGYVNLTIDKVAKRAGVARATIYRRWSGKQALVVEAARFGLKELDIPDVGSFREEIRMYLMARLSWFVNDESSRATAAILAAVGEDPATEAAFGARTEVLVTPVTNAVLRAQARGEIRSDIDVETLKSMVSAPLTFTANYRRIRPTPQLVEAVVDIIYRGVVAEDTPT